MVGRRKSRGLAIVIAMLAVLAGAFSSTSASAGEDHCFNRYPAVGPDPGITELVGDARCNLSFQCSTFPCDVVANMRVYGVGVMSGFMEIDMANGQILRGACGPEPLACQVNLSTNGFTSGFNHVTCVVTGVPAVGGAMECSVTFS